MDFHSTTYKTQFSKKMVSWYPGNYKSEKHQAAFYCAAKYRTNKSVLWSLLSNLLKGQHIFALISKENTTEFSYRLCFKRKPHWLLVEKLKQFFVKKTKKKKQSINYLLLNCKVMIRKKKLFTYFFPDITSHFQTTKEKFCFKWLFHNNIV